MICRSSLARISLRCTSASRTPWLLSHTSPITTSYLVTRPRLVIPLPRRPFSITRSLAEGAKPPNASQQPDHVLLKQLSETTLYRKLSGDPEALKEMTSFVQLLQSKGIDPSSGKTPGTLQMIKLLSDSEFREAAKRMQERLQGLGIDLKSPEIMGELMALKKT